MTEEDCAKALGDERAGQSTQDELPTGQLPLRPGESTVPILASEKELGAQILEEGREQSCPRCGNQTDRITHPRSLVQDPDHISTSEIFQNDLLAAFSGGIPQVGYPEVRVLIIRWEHDDLGVVVEITELEKRFRTLHFTIDPHVVIPGETEADNPAAAEALRDAVTNVRRSVTKEELLIVYYAGHGKLMADNKSYWAAHGKRNSAWLPWHPLQFELEDYIPNDVVFIFDCCYAASAGTRSTQKGIAELLAASAKESAAIGVCSQSFTRRLIFALDRVGSVPFTVSQLYSDILRSPLDVVVPNYQWSQHELKVCQKSPVYDPLSRSAKSITMAKVSTEDWAGLSEEAKSRQRESLKSGNLVILSIAVNQEVMPASDCWRSWFLTLLPSEVKGLAEVKLIGAWGSQSSLLLVQVPVQIWNLLPERPAYKFVEVVKSYGATTSELDFIDYRSGASGDESRVDKQAVPTSPGNDGLRRLESLVTEVSSLPESRIPIVLVSGFSGWGEPLFGTFSYWGGFGDLPTALLNAGYAVLIVKIGPLSSNRERACEIYAQLTNIQNNGGFGLPGAPPTQIPVDYGNGHPSPYLIQNPQSAQTWQAVLFGNLPNNWQWSAANQVNFICHSQGGTTLRYLIELMSGRHVATHPSFSAISRQNWIKSVVTLGSPHKGTTVTDVVSNLLPRNYPDLLNLISRLVVSASFKPPGSRFYDLQLDHWGFFRLPGESFQAMDIRLRNDVHTWWQSNSHGFYDNSIPGTMGLDTFASTPSPHIYYFTMSFSATDPFPNRTLDDVDINSFFDLFPLSKIFNPFGLLGPPIALGLFFSSRITALPELQAFAGWFTAVANRHLQQMNYFSQLPPPGTQVPRPDMLPFLSLFGYSMGGYNLPNNVLPHITSEQYHPNDGIVNTESMSGPIGGPIQEGNFPVNVMMTNPAATKGIYWHLGKNATMDHADQIGVFTDSNTYKEVEYMYLQFARLLSCLP
ncbi:alpha/beta-hydrolase [Cadophora sp. DSE1049]|nr:alpha/beta-hydrolase [Cadophora sp. DSE1049]